MTCGFTRDRKASSTAKRGVMMNRIPRWRREMKISRPLRGHLQTVLNQLPAILWTTNRDLAITSIAGKPFESLGLTHDEVIGWTLAQFYKTDNPRFPGIVAHRRALRGEFVDYDRVRRGIHFHSHVEPLQDAAGNICGVIGIAFDITKRAQRERKLRKALAQLKRKSKETRTY